jgi:hypothetical protein
VLADPSDMLQWWPSCLLPVALWASICPEVSVPTHACCTQVSNESRRDRTKEHTGAGKSRELEVLLEGVLSILF